MVRRNLWLSTATSAIVISSSIQAAEINKKKIDGIDFVIINGEIGAQDVPVFDSISNASAEFSSGPTVVLLNSTGGNLLAGLTIGEIVRSHRLATAVMNGSECASVCALIWLAGTKRYLGNSAKLGFHAAYSGTGDDAKEVGQANALVGAYLSKLGLSYSAIAFATAAAPNEMQWLHPSDAERVGIQLEVIPDAVQNSQPAQAAPPNSNDSPAELQAKNVVLSYYADWCSGGIDVEKLAQYYGPVAVFYGASEPRDKIMNTKRQFSIRWPVRHYTIKPNTLFAQCSDTCSVTGVVEWDVSSAERGAHSVGSANFVLKLALNSSGIGGIILSENGAVLTAHNDTLPPTAHNDAFPSAQASLPTIPSDPAASPAYGAGRQARLDYEAWYNGLSAGDYRDGATFWAGNRSLKILPSCNQPAQTFEWRNGCLAAQARLSPIDVRRHTEKDYWLGWNSL